MVNNAGVIITHVRYSEDLKPDPLKSGLSEGGISNGPVFKWSCFSNGYSYSPNHSKSGHFCLDFKWFLTKWRLFVHISNCWASGFQIPFKIRTVCNPTSFQPFKIHTSLYFRSPLYSHSKNIVIILLNWVSIPIESCKGEKSKSWGLGGSQNCPPEW